MSLPPDTFVLYVDYAGSTAYTANVHDYTPKTVHDISGSSVDDEVSVVRWNLAPGCVVTLFDNVASLTFPDLSHAGRTYDLIGDGAEHEVNLNDLGMKDCVSAFWWRNVDMHEGYLSLYIGANYAAPVTNIFIAEWSVDDIHPLDNWYIKDEASSIKWQGMADTVNVTLYDNNNGTGASYGNIGRGQGSVSNLGDVGFNDKVSSFKITRLRPVKEEIHEVTIPNVIPQNEPNNVLLSDSGENNSPNPATLTYKKTDSVAETTQVTVAQAEAAGIGGGLEFTYTFRKAELSLDLQLEYNKALAESNTAEKTLDQEVAVDKQFTAVPYSTYTFEWFSVSGTVDVEFTATVTRWYTQQLEGTVPDGGYYKRDEKLSGRFKGLMYLDNDSIFNNPTK